MTSSHRNILIPGIMWTWIYEDFGVYERIWVKERYRIKNWRLLLGIYMYDIPKNTQEEHNRLSNNKRLDQLRKWHEPNSFVRMNSSISIIGSNGRSSKYFTLYTFDLRMENINFVLNGYPLLKLHTTLNHQFYV